MASDAVACFLAVQGALAQVERVARWMVVERGIMCEKDGVVTLEDMDMLAGVLRKGECMGKRGRRMWRRMY
jgi:hypothetical protein